MLTLYLNLRMITRNQGLALVRRKHRTLQSRGDAALWAKRLLRFLFPTIPWRTLATTPINKCYMRKSLTKPLYHMYGIKLLVNSLWTTRF